MLEKAYELAVMFSAVDNLTGPVQKMAGQLGILDEKTKEVQQRMNGFKNMAWVGGVITGIGIAGAVGMEKLAQKAAEVQQQLIQLSSVYGINIDSSQLKAIEEQAQSLSQKTLFSKQDLLGIDVELAHAGISKDNLSKVMPEATYLAEIEKGIGKSSSPQNTAYNFAKMSEDAGITGNIEKMQKFADDINRVINTTHASTESLSESFKYGMPVAKNLGWTENDMLMANAMAARNGMEGSMAGTHIKDFIERINPYKFLGTTGGQKQLEAMNEMGLLSGVQEKTGKNGKTEITGFGSSALLKDKDHLKSYADMIDVLTEKKKEFMSKGGSELQWAALANKVWGEQGQDFAVLSSNKEQFDKLKKNMEMQKELHAQIDVIRNSYNGQMHILESNLETLGLQIGKPLLEMLTPIIKKVGDELGKLIEYLNKHPEVAKFAAAIVMVATAAALVIGPITLLRGVLGYLQVAKTISTGFTLLKLALSFLLSPIGLVIAAAILLYEAWTHNWGGIRDKTHEVIEFCKQKIESIKETFESVKKSALDFVDDIKKRWDELKTIFEHPLNAIVNMTTNDSGTGLGVDSKVGIGAQTMAQKAAERAGKNANGTDYWRGGLSWVGERGPELVNLPRGSQVIPNNKIGQALQGDSQQSQGDINFYGDIVVNAQPGQSPQEIAQMVMKEIGRTMRKQSNSRSTLVTNMW